MFERQIQVLIAISIVLLIAAGAFVVCSDDEANNLLRRRLSTTMNAATSFQQSPTAADEASSFWCSSQEEVEPLDYTQCDKNDIVYRIPLEGGMTQAIKTVLLGSILAFEKNRCFFVDESEADLNHLNREKYHTHGFVARYFEPIGLSPQHPIVQTALAEQRVKSLTWREVWGQVNNRRLAHQETSIPALGYHSMQGHELKAAMMKRVWRLLPPVKDYVCKEYWQLLGHQDFITFSIRRGDKTTENFGHVSLNMYLAAADEIVRDDFDSVPPPIFVATDDCTVLDTLRSRRPSWRFVSECDQHYQTGFYLQDLAQWTEVEYDEHFGKFFVELYGMAQANYFIGISYSNVSWFAYFMRGGKTDHFKLLDTPAGTLQTLATW